MAGVVGPGASKSKVSRTYWTRRHDMTSASVIQFPPTTPTTTPMFPNLNYKIHPNLAIFKARTLKFYMVVDLDNPHLYLTSILTSASALTSIFEVKIFK